uniref:Ig-like domain-containing protein n=1 Tax=Takifugu rubripes TaxID=31033 RepID=A0A674NI58_TAKRU
MNTVCFLSLVFLGPAYSQTLYASKNPVPVGSNVTLSVQGVVTTGAWIFNNSMIVMMYPGNHIISTNWKDKVTLNLTSNQTSLTINSLWLQDSGEYVLQDLEEPISNVTLKAQATDLVELNDSAVFTCSASSGTSVSYAWLNGSSVITGSESAQLSDGGAKLTIVVTRYDQGPFSCNMSNGISHEVSSLVYLKISYGPSNAMMTLLPMKLAYRTGDNITLSCSADSSPAARIWWMFDGMDLDKTGPQLHLQNVTESNSGNYTCMLHNNVTSRFTHKMITVEAPKKEAVEGQLYTLTCNVTGPPDLLTVDLNWFKNGHWLQVDNQTTFFTDHKNIINSENNRGVLLDLLLLVGPETPVITGPEFAEIGTTAHFNCSANSYPPSTFTWWFNGSEVANSSMLTTAPLSFNMSGAYTCVAHNDVTGGNRSTTVVLTVVGKSDNNSTVPSYGALLLSVFALSLTTFLHGGGLPA